MSLPLGTRWRVRDLTGERVTEPSLDDAGRLYLSTFEVCNELTAGFTLYLFAHYAIYHFALAINIYS